MWRKSVFRFSRNTVQRVHAHPLSHSLVVGYLEQKGRFHIKAKSLWYDVAYFFSGLLI